MIQQAIIWEEDVGYSALQSVRAHGNHDHLLAERELGRKVSGFDSEGPARQSRIATLVRLRRAV